MINLSYLQSNALYEFFVPFFLVTGMVYAVFQFSKKKAATDKRDFLFNDNSIAIISAAIGFFATNNRETRDLILDWLPILIILFMIAFIILFFKKVFEKKEGDDKADHKPLLILLVFLLILIGAYGPNNLARDLTLSAQDAENILWLAGIIIAGLIIWLAYVQGVKDQGNT